MQRQTQAGFWVASFLSLALPCAGCLVTNELDFEGNRSLPGVRIVSPPQVYPVPSPPLDPVSSPGSDDCLDNEVSFLAQYSYEDVDQTLFVLAVANEDQVVTGLYQATRGAAGTPEHTPPTICVRRSFLQLACNRVELFVSDDPDRLRVANFNINQLRVDPRVVSVTWFLYGQSADMPGGAAKPYASFYDCLPPDGGT